MITTRDDSAGVTADNFQEEKSDGPNPGDFSNLLEAQNLYDTDSLYESLARSIATFDDARLPSFATAFTFDYSKFFSPIRVTQAIVLPTGWIALWNQFSICTIFCMKTGKIIDVFKQGLFSVPNIEQLIYLPINKVLVAVLNTQRYDTNEINRVVKLYKIHSAENIEEIKLPRKIECVTSVAYLTNDFFIVGSGRQNILVVDHNGNIITNKKDPSFNIATYHDMVASSTEYSFSGAINTININKLRYKNHSTPQNTRSQAKLIEYGSLTSSQPGLMYSHLAFINDTFLAATSYDSGYLYNYNYQVSIWNVTTKQLMTTITSTHQINQLLTLPNGWLCVLNLAKNDNLQIWNVQTNKIELSYTLSSGDNKISLAANSYLIIPQKGLVTFQDVAITAAKMEFNVMPTRPSIFKFRLFYFHNILKRYRKKAMLAGENLQEDDIYIISRLIKYGLSIMELDFRYNSLGNKLSIDPLLTAIMNLIYENKTISIIDFSENNFTQSTFCKLVTYLRDNRIRTITSINVSNNNLLFNKMGLENLEKDLKEIPRVDTVDLSQNYLESECDSLFEEEKDEDASFSYSFFKSTHKAVTSIIDPEIPLNKGNWLVCFATSKIGQHAFILLEGVRTNGQRFLKKFHITTGDIWIYGKAKAEELYEPPSKYEKDHYHILSFNITNTQGTILQKSIAGDISNKSDVDWTCFRSTRTTRVNCADWCINHLREIGIDVNTTVIPLPRNIARQSSCVIS